MTIRCVVTALRLNRFFVSEYLPDGSEGVVRIRGDPRSQSLLRQRILPDVPTSIPTVHSGRWSQSLLRQRISSGRSGVPAAGDSSFQCLNRFFVSEYFRTHDNDRGPRCACIRLNRFFVSEYFRTTAGHRVRVIGGSQRLNRFFVSEYLPDLAEGSLPPRDILRLNRFFVSEYLPDSGQIR